MPGEWIARGLEFIDRTEGKMYEVYDDRGSPAIGSGHRLLPGEDFSDGIDEAKRLELRNADFATHWHRKRQSMGGAEFDALGERERVMLTLQSWAGQKAPRFTAAAVEGNVQGMLEEYPLYWVEGDEKRPLQHRNDLFYDYFLKDIDPNRGTPREGGNALQKFVATPEFQNLDPEGQMRALIRENELFGQLASMDPAKATEVAKQLAHVGRGETDLWDNFAAGGQKGWGQAVATFSEAIALAEDTGLFDTDLDDSLLAYGKQKIVDADSRIGTSTSAQIASALGQIGGAALPGLVGAAALYAGGAALGAGSIAGGVPLAIGAEGVGFGLAEYLRGRALDPENAEEMGAEGAFLGAAGGATSFLPRKVRMPLDFAAGTGAALYRGAPLADALVQGGSLALIAGIPGKRPPSGALREAGVEPDSFPGAARALDESLREENVRAGVKAMLDRPLETPIETVDGRMLTTAKQAMDELGGEYEMKGVHFWHPQDMTPRQIDAFRNADADSAVDGRAFGVSEQKAGGWAPGWRYQPMRAFGANPETITSKTGSELLRPGEIIADLAEPYGMTITRGNTKGAGGRRTLGWHARWKQETKVLHFDDVQTAAHEWAHHLVTTDDTLKRWVRGADFDADMDRLRTFLLDKELNAGRGADPVLTSQNPLEVPVKALRRWEDDLPPDLRYMAELASVSYDRADPEEGLAELFRVIMTNDTEFGGTVDTRKMFPAGREIFDDWVSTQSPAQQKAIRRYRQRATEFAGQDAATSALARMGGDVSTESLLQSRWSKFRQAVIDSNEGVWNVVANAVDPREADRVVAYLQSAQASNRLTNLAINRAVPMLARDSDGHLKQAISGQEGLEAILIDAVGDKPAKEMFNALGVYATARRQRELYDQVYVEGQGVRFVKDHLKRIMKKLNADYGAGRPIGKRADALRRKYNAKTITEKEVDDLLAFTGATRRERRPLAEIEENLKIAQKDRYKHFGDIFDRMKSWQRAVREYGRESGLYGKDQIDLWDKFDSEYLFPFYRAEAEGGAGIRTLKGSERPLDGDWLDLVFRGAEETFARAEDNLANAEFVKSVLNSQKAGSFFEIMDPLSRSKKPLGPHELYQVIGSVPKPASGKVISFKENGNTLHYTVKDDGAYRALKYLHPDDQGKVLQYGNAVRTAMQDAITLNPEFFVPALFRDVTGGFLFSKTKGNIFGKAMKGFWSALRNDADYQSYLANVGTHAQLTNTAHSSPAALRRSVQRATGGWAHDIIRGQPGVIRTLRRITNAIESSVRVGEYKSALAMGAPEKHAAWLGTQIQPNFAAHGTNELLRGLAKVTPFLNATMQSIDRFGRGLFRDPDGRGQIAAKLAGLTMAGVALNEINRRLDPQYEDRPDWLKRAYFVIPVPLFDENGFQTDENGNLKIERALIAKNHEVALVENVAEYAFDMLHSDDDPEVAEAAGDVVAMLLSGLGVNVAGDQFPLPLPIGVGLGVELYANKDLFTGNPIVPLEQAALQSWAQAGNRTPKVWRDYGRFMHDSPMVPDWLKQSSAASPQVAQHIWRYFTAQTGAQAEMLTEIMFNPERMGTRLRDGPVLRRLNLRDDKYSRVPTDFYETASEMRQLADTIDAMKEQGDWETFRGMLDSREEALRYSASKAIGAARAQMSRLNDQQDMIRRVPGLTPMERTLQYEKIEKMKRELQKLALEQWDEVL